MISAKKARGGRLRNLWRDEEESQSGATIVLVAFVMTVLIGFAAFAVDFGWLYLNGIRIQHGADAAALAGVVYEPGDQATAYAEALKSAQENGYNDALSGTTVTPVDFSDDPTAVENQYQLSVTIDHNVETFFMRVFGVDDITMTKKAVAEYVLPLPMGSNLPYFGEDPDTPGRDPHFWANIHGYYTGRTMGDRYSSQCLNGGSGSGCTLNDDRRQTTYNGSGVPITGGYLYGIELEADSTNFLVEVFDGPFYRGGSDYFLVGDQPQGGSVGPTTHFVLYEPDPTPLNTSDNNVLCHVVFAPEDTFADFDADGDVGSRSGNDWIADPDDDLWPTSSPDGFFTWEDVEEGLAGGIGSLWDTVCYRANATAGIYPLRVAIDDPGADDERGLNRFSLRSSVSGADQPRFYGLGDMAVYVNFDGNTSTFNLAEVYPVHAGKELVIELWDPDSGNNGVEIYRPDGTLPQCTWSATDGRSGGPGACDINYTTSFNNHHMQIRIQIDPAYTCDTDPDTGNCWWTIEVSYPGGANDTTTWSARIEGNPVALVE